MKRFTLDLSDYMVEGMKDFYPIRENLSNILRAPSIFEDGAALCEALQLAKSIRDAKLTLIEMDDREVGLLKHAINRHLKLTAEGRAVLGGPVHEEMITRVFNMEELVDA